MQPLAGRPFAVIRLRAPQWAAALAGAVVLSLIIAVRNHYGLRMAGRPVEPLWVFFVGELAAWLVWVFLLPAIMWLALRFPPVGARVVRNAVLHVIAGLVIAVLPLLAVIITRFSLPGPETPALGDPQFWTVLMHSYIGNSLASLFVYGTVVGLMLAWTYHREEQERRARESQLEATLARTERDLLRMQIHPHFLFNTLHAINALVVDDPRGARSMVARLSDLLRLSLDDDARHEVTLEEEVAFLAHYIEIQQIRFRDRLTIIENIAPEALPKLVPRLMLQPLLENAIQHGIAQNEEGGRITIAARIEADMLMIEVADDGPGPGTDSVPRRAAGSGAGLGLRNTSARLRQLYGSAATVVLESRPEGGAIVRVRMPAHEESSPYTSATLERA